MRHLPHKDPQAPTDSQLIWALVFASLSFICIVAFAISGELLW